MAKIGCHAMWCPNGPQDYGTNYNGRYAMPKKKEKKRRRKKKAVLNTVLHIRELPHSQMKLAVWFSFPATNNKNPMIPS